MANLERLLQVLQAGIEEPVLEMSCWKRISPCGTTHCLFGSYLEKYQPGDIIFVSVDESYFNINAEDITKLHLPISDVIGEHLDISPAEARFLFAIPYASNVRSAVYLNRSEALNRLRKFIFYKFIKQYEVPYYRMLPTIQHAFKYETIVNDMMKFIHDFIRFHKSHKANE
jgi:hypothetical protein